MEISAESPDEAQLATFVASGWTAATLDPREDFYERWHGSSLILAAAERNLLSPAEAVTRIVPERYGDAAECLGHGAVGAPLAGLLTQAVARVRSEEHTSELQSLMRTSYAVFCLQKKKIKTTT